MYQAAYLVAPGWRLFRQQERIAVWIVFGLALLAGLGAAVLQRRQDTPQVARLEAAERRGVYRGYWVAAIVAALFAAVCFVGYLAGRDALWGFAASGLFLALVLALAPLALRSRQPAWLIGLIVLDLFALDGGQHAGNASTPQVWPPTPITMPSPPRIPPTARSTRTSSPGTTATAIAWRTPTAPARCASPGTTGCSRAGPGRSFGACSG